MDGKPPSLLATLTRLWAASGGHGFSSKGKVGFCARERPQCQEEGGGERASVTDTSGPPARVRPGRPPDPCTPSPSGQHGPKAGLTRRRWPASPPGPPRPDAPPRARTCGEPRFGGRLLHRHGEGGRRRGRLCPGQRPVAAKGHGDAGGLHGRLVVPQLVDPLLLQEEGLLGERRHGCSLLPGKLPPLWLNGYKISSCKPSARSPVHWHMPPGPGQAACCPRRPPPTGSPPGPVCCCLA